MTQNLTNQVVFLTGASRGIGAAAARAFVEAGAKVALVARSEAPLAQLRTELGDAVLPLPCDVADFDAVSAAHREAEARLGPVSVLINNAAILAPIAPLAEADPAEWAQLIDINVNGVFNCTRAVLPGMLARGGGTILTVSSGAAHSPYEGWSAYCASKAAAAMMTRSLDLEYRAAGIRAFGLSPGTVATQMQRDIKASGVNPVSELDWEDHAPPEWPARALLWMASADADAHIGEELRLRGEVLSAKLGIS